MLANIVIYSFIIFGICTFIFCINYTEEQKELSENEDFEALKESYKPIQHLMINIGALSLSSFIISGVLMLLSIISDLWIKYVL